MPLRASGTGLTLLVSAACAAAGTLVGLRGLLVRGFGSYEGIVSAFGTLAATLLGAATLAAALRRDAAVFKVRAGAAGGLIGGALATVTFEVQNAGAASAVGDARLTLPGVGPLAAEAIAPFGALPVPGDDLAVPQNGRRVFQATFFVPPGANGEGATLRVRPVRGREARCRLDADVPRLIGSRTRWT